MTNPPIQPSSSRPLKGAEGAPQSASGSIGAAGSKQANPAFRVLLERLQAQAQELESKTDGLEAPEHLAEAVDIARASLDDALSLSDRLLEAFREAQHQADQNAGETDKEDRQ